jgi:hypothetical protein
MIVPPAIAVPELAIDDAITEADAETEAKPVYVTEQLQQLPTKLTRKRPVPVLKPHPTYGVIQRLLAGKTAARERELP